MKEIKSTKDYKRFKKLKGNRDVENFRVNKIIQSIKRVGYITSPIIVNEKMEIIDGQGRLEALKQLKLPVEYIIHEGIGIDECVSMNVYQTNWKNIDYIKSYAQRGFTSYNYVLKLIEKYPNMPINTFAVALCEQNTFQSSVVSKGNLEITQEQYEKAIERIEEIQELIPIIQQTKYNFDILVKGIMFSLMLPEVNKEKLFDKIRNDIKSLDPFHTIGECMQSIEELYNYKQVKRVYIYTLYRIMMRENNKRGFKKVNIQNKQNKKEASEETIIDTKEKLQDALEEIRQQQ